MATGLGIKSFRGLGSFVAKPLKDSNALLWAFSFLFFRLLFELSPTPMSIKVLIPTPLQKFVGDQSALECEADSISQLVEALEAQHPGIKARLCDDTGKLRRFVNFYLNSEDIRFMENEATILNDGDEVSIVPAIAGG